MLLSQLGIRLNEVAALYATAKTNALSQQGKSRYLFDTIIPSDRLVIAGNGAALRTTRGEMIDFQSMTVNCLLGQNDPWVKLNQISYLLSDRPSFHSTRFGSELYYSLPSRLARLGIAGIPDPAISHRQCNGSDVIEQAIAAAYQGRGRRNRLISFTGSYHGQNLTCYAVSHLQRKHMFLTEPPEVLFIEAPENANCGGVEAQLSAAEAQALDTVGANATKAFAVILEPIQVNNDVNCFSRRFLAELKRLCLGHDIALIFDEVQTGFGWLGRLTAAEYLAVVPTAIVLGKAITAGNGPLAILVSEQRLRHVCYGTAAKTNGADVRALVAAHAVLDRLLGIPKNSIPDFVTDPLRSDLVTGLIHTVPPKSMEVERALQAIVDDRIGIERVNGEGMIRGLPVFGRGGKADAARAAKIVDACFERGLFLRHGNHVLIVKPPITITSEQIEKGAAILHDAIRACQ